MNQPAVRRGLRIPRPLLALLMGGAAAAGVYWYVGTLPQSAPQAVAPAIARAPVAVARIDLEARTLLRPDLFELRQLPQEAIAPGAVASLDEVRGMMLAVPVAAGEQLLTTKLRDPSVAEFDKFADMIPPGKRALAVNFAEVTGSGGLIVPGDHVDVVAIFDRDAMGKDQAMILMQNVLVLAVAQSTSLDELGGPAGRTGGSPNGQSGGMPDPQAPQTEAPTVAGPAAKPSPPATPEPAPVPSAPQAKTVTLAVDPEAAIRLALAEAHGHLRYALRRSGETDAPDVVPADLATIRSPILPTSAEVVAVEISPTNVKVGETLTVHITVRNTSDRPLQTQGPGPGFTYVQGQTYYSQEFTSEPGRWRVALGSDGLDATELPYRWGFGADLASGATTTVTGHLTVTHDFRATNFWAAVVEEPANIVQTGAGMTMVTALPENTAVVAVDVANVRSGPSIASSVVGQVRYGTELEILGQANDWFKVQLPDQRQVWIAAGWIVTAGR